MFSNASPGDPPREFPAQRGFSLYYRGKTLLSHIDPISQAERSVDRLTAKDGTLYLCPSPLYGYGLSRLLEKIKILSLGTIPGNLGSPNKNSAILCVEADEKLFELSQKAMKPLLDDGLLVLARLDGAGNNMGELCALVKKTWGERMFRRVEVSRLNSGWQLFPELYERTAAALNRDISLAWTNAMTLIRLGRLFIRNAVRNLPLIPRLADISFLNFGAAPLLVLGAGPSLDIMLDELAGFLKSGARENRPFRIICADTCIPCLKERNIEPDLVVILESQHWNLRDFSGARGWKVPAALDLSALPASTRVLEGAAFLFSIPWTELRLFRRLEQAGLLPPGLTPLGSVGLSAAELALKLGSGPVVAAGLDFSFTLDAYHARSSPGHLACLARTNRFNSPLNVQAAFRDGTFPARSKSGHSVRSDPALENYRNLFEGEFAGAPRFFEIKGPGLSLGLRQLEPTEAARRLTGIEPRAGKNPPDTSGKPGPGGMDLFDNPVGCRTTLISESKKTSLERFVHAEKERLLRLKAMLTGTNEAEEEEKENLLDALDYLWAHFPECAAAGGRRPKGSDLSFLNRVRAEIDPFLSLWDQALRENGFSETP